MLMRQEVHGRMIAGGELRLNVHYPDGLTLRGTAQCDAVCGSRGKLMLRARFGHSIKAILDFASYGETWEAEAL